MWVPKEIRVGNIAPLSLSQISLWFTTKAVHLKIPTSYQKIRAEWHSAIFSTGDLLISRICAVIFQHLKTHIGSCVQLKSAKKRPPPPPPRPHSLGHLRCSDISSPIISCYAPVISFLEHCIVMSKKLKNSYLPGIVWVASLSTCSRVVRETDAPNMIPSAVSSTAFNSGMWVGAIRIG